MTSFRWLAQLSTSNKMFLPCTQTEASCALRNSVHMLVAIHAFLFLQYLTLFKHSSYFPTMIGMNNNNRNNNAKSQSFNCWTERKATRMVQNSTVLTTVEHFTSWPPLLSPPPVSHHSYLAGTWWDFGSSTAFTSIDTLPLLCDWKTSCCLQDFRLSPLCRCGLRCSE
jgi:hypothetical protein